MIKFSNDILLSVTLYPLASTRVSTVSVNVGDRSVIGANAEIHGRVGVGPQCRIGASVFIGTIKDGDRLPGRVVLGESVRVGAGTIIENASELDLLIPDQAEIPARSYVVNDGCGQPRFVRE